MIRRLARYTLYAIVILGLVIGAKAWQNRRDVVAITPVLTDEGTNPWTTFAPGTFFIENPYGYDGNWYQVQLHTHTNRSIDGKWTAEQSLRAYAEAGYDFVAITDHDTVTRIDGSPHGLILIPAEENTVTFPFWPLGQHAVYLFVDDTVRRGSAVERFSRVQQQGGIIQIAHPNWIGNLGLGRWEMKHLMAADHFTLMEIYNPHSDYRLDTQTWHETSVRRGPEHPVWAVAVDDAHDESLFHLGWTMVKADDRSLEALKEALKRGSLYPTTGLLVEFDVQDGSIIAQIRSDGPTNDATIRFIDAAGNVVLTVEETQSATYSPQGSEGFVRVEVVQPATRRRAWSQPFWLSPIHSF